MSIEHGHSSVTIKLYQQKGCDGGTWWRWQYIDGAEHWHYSARYYDPGSAAIAAVDALDEAGVDWDRWDIPEGYWGEVHAALHAEGLLPSQR